MKKRPDRAAAVVFLAVFSSAGLAFAQAPIGGYRFETASVRPTIGNAEFQQNVRAALRAAGGGSTPTNIYTVSGKRVDTEGIQLSRLITLAYQIDRMRVVAPSWIDESRFVIHAAMPEGATAENIPEMFRSLLEDRFHIVVSRVPQPLEGFRLVRGKGALKLASPKDQDLSACQPWADNPSTGGASCTSRMISGPNVAAQTKSPWGPYTRFASGLPRLGGTAHTEYFRITMPEFASFLSGSLSSPAQKLMVPVTDGTGIEGEWDIVLELAFGSPSPSTDGSSASGASDPSSSISVYSSGVEKLGLRLEKATLPVDVLKIDQIDKVPTEN